MMKVISLLTALVLVLTFGLAFATDSIAFGAKGDREERGEGTGGVDNGSIDGLGTGGTTTDGMGTGGTGTAGEGAGGLEDSGTGGTDSMGGSGSGGSSSSSGESDSRNY